ncbi:MAG: TetR/AcrR family transcriptional regulator [Bacteroidales bacterium]|nr:TetR/AcrR family transcriptional regulator [Bacteroidales bacterium]
MDKKKTQSKKELILKAAEEVFMANGYEATKTTQIAERAGVTHAMLHYYFHTKENIFRKIYEDKINMLKDPIVALVENKEMELPQRIDTIIETHFEFLKDNPTLPYFVISEMNNNPHLIETMKENIGEVMGESYKKLQNEIDEYVAQGIINPITALDLLLDIVSLNVSAFVMLPIMKSVVSDKDEQNAILEQRKKEIKETINRRIIKTENKA